VRLKPDGSIDPDAPTLRTLAALPDARLLMAGSFNTVNGVPRAGIARIFLGPAQPGPHLIGRGLDKGQFEMTIPFADAGKQYFLESRDSVTGGTWQPRGSVTGKDSCALFSDPSATNSSRIYRVREE